MPIEVTDRVVFRKELAAQLHVGSECIRRYIKLGKLPKPDVDFSSRTKGWRLSTLHAAGIRLV